MLENFYWLMETIREEIMEKFIIPGLGISYWKFLIYLLIVGVVATVLINGVRVSSSNAVKASSKKHSEKEDRE